MIPLLIVAVLLKLKSGDFSLPALQFPMPTGRPSISPKGAGFPGAGGGGGVALACKPSAPGLSTASALKITPLTPAIGATVEGLTLSESLSPRNREQIRAALVEFQVLIYFLRSLYLYLFRNFRRSLDRGFLSLSPRMRPLSFLLHLLRTYPNSR